MQSYSEFLDLSVGFPQDGYSVIDDELYFQDLNLMEMIETYGSPLRFTYLPIVSKKRLISCWKTTIKAMKPTFTKLCKIPESKFIFNAWVMK